MSERWRTREARGPGLRRKQQHQEKTSAGSYLDQPFVLWKESCAPACTSALRMLDCNGWAALFCLSPLLTLTYIWSDNSVYRNWNGTFKEGIDSDSILKDDFLQNFILKQHHKAQKSPNESHAKEIKLLWGSATHFANSEEDLQRYWCICSSI